MHKNSMPRAKTVSLYERKGDTLRNGVMIYDSFAFTHFCSVLSTREIALCLIVSGAIKQNYENTSLEAKTKNQR